MTFRSGGLLVLAFVMVGLFGGCAGMNKGEPSVARYEIQERFRISTWEDRFGVRVTDGTQGKTLSKAQVDRISKFLANTLQETGQFGLILDLNSDPDIRDAQLVINVKVTTFEVASEQELSQGKKSLLYGEVLVTDSREENRGTAMVWADGMNLKVVGENLPPDTIRLFAGAIADLLD